MSRIGKKPVELPSGVTAAVSGQTIEVKGPKGVRSFTASDDVTLVVEEGKIVISPRGKSKRALQQWGMSRTMVANCVTGVNTGFKKEFAKNRNVTYENSIRKTIEGSDLVIIHTEWNDFKSINFKSFSKKKKFIIYDMRNIYSSEKIKEHGLKYYSIGR